LDVIGDCDLEVGYWDLVLRYMIAILVIGLWDLRFNNKRFENLELDWDLRFAHQLTDIQYTYQQRLI